jgi:flavodoxin
MGILMKIELYHASKFGNGAMVAEELKRVMEARGHQMNVHHIAESRPKELLPADLYVFGSPTRMGKPRGSMHRFSKKVSLPSGTKYALFATHSESVPDKKTGRMPTDEEMSRFRRTIPILDEILIEKGLIKVADKIFFVSGEEMKGHLIEGWQGKVVEFATSILDSS